MQVSTQGTRSYLGGAGLDTLAPLAYVAWYGNHAVIVRTAMTISRALAETRLRKRYHQQALIYPLMWNEVPLDVYIRSNVHKVMQNDLLADYDRLPNWHPVNWHPVTY
jgi:hypothetical protein